MTRPKVIIIAMNQPLDTDAHLRERMSGAEKRAERQAHRFKGLDLPGTLRAVHRHLRRTMLRVDGRFMDLLDLMNYVRNGRRPLQVTPENVSEAYSLAQTVSLNGIYLYQFLKNEGYDPILVQNYALADLESLMGEEPLAACISSNYIFMEEIKAMAGRIKAIRPETAVVAGGMLVKKVLDAGDALPSDAKQYLSSFSGKVDAFVIEAHGEQTLAKYLRCLSRGEPPAGVPNLGLFSSDGSLRFTRRQAEDVEVDETAIQWDQIPRRYLRPTLPVNSSRGCHYRCRFCTYHWYFPRVHYKSLQVLRDELCRIRDLGFVRHVRFTDDNFTADPKRFRAVLEMMIRESFGFSWSSFARASALKPDLVRLMKRAGCEFVDMGIESGSDAVLRNMDKKLRREQSLEAIRALNAEGIYSRGSFIVGFPGETEETFLDTVALINESRLPYYHPYLFYYSRQSPVHKERDRFGLQGIGLSWRHDTMDAAEAAGHMGRMIRLVEQGYTDGIAYVEEVYKILRGKGYAPPFNWPWRRGERRRSLLRRRRSWIDWHAS
ncbi:MAG: radical SAM protein [Deltaproteobacteria bacterium]|nr:radical SAM protein [Deltaproteobacteria bacterium]